MPIQQLVFGWAGQNGVNPISSTVTIEADGEDNRTILCEGDITAVSISWGADKLRSIYMTVDGPITLLTNDPDSPQDTIELTDGHPFVWDYLSGISPQFAGAVDGFYFEKPDPTQGDVTVIIKVVLDATP